MYEHLVSKDEIDALVTFAVQEDMSVIYNEKEYKVAECPDCVGQMLSDTNRESNADVGEVVEYPVYRSYI